MKESFIFYSSFAEALSEMPDKSRLKLYDAIIELALHGVETEFKGIEKAVFSLIKPQIKANNQRYENGKKGAESGVKGGAPKGNDNAKKNNPKTTPKQPQNNPNGFKENNGIGVEQNNPKTTPNENVNVNVNVSPPIIPPKGAGEDLKNRFFELYPAFNGKRSEDDTGVDYAVLIREFALSEKLRGMYSFPKIVSMYKAIERGDFRDRKDAITESANARADRERWYSMRRQEAESKAEKVLKRCLQNEDFAKLHKRLNSIIPEMVKLEVDSEKGDLKAKKDYEILSEEQEKLKLQYDFMLEQNGMTEEDLKPKWHCLKCQDTGFLKDGKMCDCFSE